MRIPLVGLFVLLTLVLGCDRWGGKSGTSPKTNAEKEQFLSMCSFGDYHSVKDKIETGMDVDLQGEIGQITPLIAVALGKTHHSGNHKQIVEYLLAHGANPNLTMKGGSGPLYHSARNGHCDLVELLLDGGAKIDIQTIYGTTPLMAAAAMGHDSVVRYLIKRGANPLVVDRNGHNATSMAKANGHPNIEKYLSELSENGDLIPLPQK